MKGIELLLDKLILDGDLVRIQEIVKKNSKAIFDFLLQDEEYPPFYKIEIIPKKTKKLLLINEEVKRAYMKHKMYALEVENG